MTSTCPVCNHVAVTDRQLTRHIYVEHLLPPGPKPHKKCWCGAVIVSRLDCRTSDVPRCAQVQGGWTGHYVKWHLGVPGPSA